MPDLYCNVILAAAIAVPEASYIVGFGACPVHKKQLSATNVKLTSGSVAAYTATFKLKKTTNKWSSQERLYTVDVYAVPASFFSPRDEDAVRLSVEPSAF